MKKAIILCLVVLLLFSTSVVTFAAKIEDQVPAKVKVISQSCMPNALCVTVIDLSNNEVVILIYGLMVKFTNVSLVLSEVKRTGMFVDPNSQGSIGGQDAQYTPNTNLEKDKNEKK